MPPHRSQRVDERKRGRKRPLRVGLLPLLKLGRVPGFPKLGLEPLDLGTEFHHRRPRRLPALASDHDRIKPTGMERAQPVRRVRQTAARLAAPVRRRASRPTVSLSCHGPNRANNSGQPATRPPTSLVGGRQISRPTMRPATGMETPWKPLTADLTRSTAAA